MTASTKSTLFLWFEARWSCFRPLKECAFTLGCHHLTESMLRNKIKKVCREKHVSVSVSNIYN